jgi:NAD-dependent deacetylase
MQRARELSESAKVFIVVGSSLQVQPAASFPVIAKQSGAFLAIINRDATFLDPSADFTYHDAIGDFFRQLNPLVANS